MASSINLPNYSDALIVLGTAGIVVPLVHRWGISPVLGYLGAGALLGPLGLGSFVAQIPQLFWVTISDAKNVSGIADLGVVFLLFLIGLELSYERLLSMRRMVFGLGSLQVFISTAVLAVIIARVGHTPAISIMLGACLALSSTAIVLDVLSSQGRLSTQTGRASFAVLIAQDLAVIPLLIFVSILGAGQGGSVITTVALALVQALAAVGLIVGVGRAVLRPLFRQVARTQSSELFIAAILFVIIATGVIAAVANLSMALGAFVAGLLLAETEYRKAIEATIEPFKGLLLGLFFFTVGMGIDAREMAHQPLLLAAAVIGLIGLKAGVLIGLGLLFKLPRAAALEIGLLLGPSGEFAFVGIGLAAALAIIPREVASFTLAVTSLTMVLIPLLATAARKFSAALENRGPVDPALLLTPIAQKQHAIVVGYGRVGKVICSMLERHGIAYTVVDTNAMTVSEERGKGQVVYFGDASKPAFLKACGIVDASGVIITIHTSALIEDIVHAVRHARPDILIVSRARDADHARNLYALGVTDAVPETIEASLQLSEAALVGLGIPTGHAIASIHEQRDVFRHELQVAAKVVGVVATSSVKRKRRSGQHGRKP